MKTVEMERDHDYTPKSDERITVAYKAGVTYTRVPNAHADEIVAAGKGRVMAEQADESEAATEGKAGRGRRG